MRLKALLGPLPDAGASALFTAVFFLIFAGICIYAYSKARKPVYEHLEKLPLEDK